MQLIGFTQSTIINIRSYVVLDEYGDVLQVQRLELNAEIEQTYSLDTVWRV